MLTTTNMPPQVLQSFDELLLSTPTPNLIHSIPVMRRRMPSNGGTTLRMSRYNRLPTSPVPLGNTGVTPPSVDAERVDIDVRMQFYGQWIAVSEQVTLQVQDPVLTSLGVRLGASMRETEDQLIRDMLAGTAAMINCVGGVSGDAPTELAESDISAVISTLLGYNAKSVAQTIKGSTQIGTNPIRNSYVALAHSNMSQDLENIAGFTYASAYPSQANILPSEWGSVKNLRFFVSSEGSVTANASANGNDIYNIFCCGMEAATIVNQDSYRGHFRYNPPNIAGGPLGLYASVGWKMPFACGITNDQWVTNLRATLYA